MVDGGVEKGISSNDPETIFLKGGKNTAKGILFEFLKFTEKFGGEITEEKLF